MVVRRLVSLNKGTPQLISPQTSAGDTVDCPITLNAATGNQIAYDLQYTVNKATSGNDTGLLINQTDTASPGTSLLQDWQVGGTSVAHVPASGYLNSAGFELGNFTAAGGGSITSGFEMAVPTQMLVNINGTNAMKITKDVVSVEGGQLNIGWGGSDIQLYRDGAGDILAQRSGANPQESRLYGDYASATDFQRNAIVTKRTATTVPIAASFTLSSFIPDGALLIGITTRVDTTCTTATGYDVGDGVDVNLWGSVAAVLAGTASGSADFTAAGASGAFYQAANDVVITATGGNFDGTGVITVCAHYMITEAD